MCLRCKKWRILKEPWRWEPVFGDQMNHDSCEDCRVPIHQGTYAADRLFEEILELDYGEYHEEWDEGRHPIYRWFLDYCVTDGTDWSDWDQKHKAESFRSLAQAMWESPRKFHQD